MINKDFKNPPKEYRPISFWSLNGKLERDELIKQIDSLKDAGWGGYFLHARHGLETPYMSDEWMDRLQDCITHGKEIGMDAWLYDEDCWPSGTASNTVAKLDPAFRETHLFFALDSIPHHKEDILDCRVYLSPLVKNKNGKLYGMETFEAPSEFCEITADEAQSCPEGYRKVYIYCWRAPLSNSRFGGGSYIDLMNPDAAKAFIELTHDKYAERYGESFGKTIPGIFTDDITTKWDLYGAKRQAIPWTPKLPQFFEEMFGYDILQKLPDLFFNTPTSSATRADYIRAVTLLSAENFVGVIADWCEKHNLMLTGHLMGNEGKFADIMYLFYLMQAPATDHLGYNTDDFRKIRRSMSVAEQFDKKYTYCETFAGVGFDISLERQKMQTDYLALAGARVLVPHISQYALAGNRKFDHPPTFSYHNPYWSKMKLLGDYQGRLGYSLSRGCQAADVLLIDNIESKSIASAVGVGGSAGEYDAGLGRVEELMLACHCEFAYGSEELMQRFASVADGRLKLGSRSYKAVVVPPALTLRSSTLELLEGLLRDGGEVIVINKLPTLCDGRKNGNIKDMLKRARVVSFGGLTEALGKYSLSLTDRDNGSAARVETALRRDGEETLCFIRNTSESAKASFTVNLPFEADVYNYDLMSGEIIPIEHGISSGCTAVDISLENGGSILIAWKKNKDASVYSSKKHREARRIAFAGPYSLTVDAPNLLILDKFTQICEDGSRGDEKYAVAVKNSKGLRLEAEFYAKAPIGEDLKLFAEYADELVVSLNGTELHTDGRHFIYPELKALPIPAGCIKDGKNTVTVYAPNGFPDSVQPIYVAGDFRVDMEDERFAVISGRIPTCICRDLTGEGLPFYAGNATLECKLSITPEKNKTYRLVFDRLDSILLDVEVNGKMAGNIVCAPYELDVTDLLTDGENSIKIKLYGSLRNMLGPHHISTAPSLIKFISPAHFTSHASFADTYSCVRFGIAGASLAVFE